MQNLARDTTLIYYPYYYGISDWLDNPYNQSQKKTVVIRGKHGFEA